jgi:hypothetical protein
MAVEFSYKYGDDQEEYSGSLGGDAHDFLQHLRGHLPKWVNPKAMDKTDFVYRTTAPAAAAKEKS